MINTPKEFQGGIDFEKLKKFAIKGFREIREVPGVAWNERCIGFPVTGDSLKNIGILHGDILVTKITDKFVENALCVWETPNGRTAKFAYKNFDEIVLHNKADWKQSWGLSEAKCFGVVVRIERDLEVRNDS